MARLELIDYHPQRAVVSDGSIEWMPHNAGRAIDRLPQIFWSTGHPWSEANLLALEMARNRDVKLKTINTLFEHIHKYANWLESEQIDWRHFPKNKAERVLVRYRGSLVTSRDSGDLTPSTTSARMRAVIRFYRFCSIHNFISREAPKWQDKIAVVRYFDTVGFERTLMRLTTDISIPNRSRPGLTLEDGLTPLTSEHMLELLRFSEKNTSNELHLMLLIGFFTGARLGTITTLRIRSIEQAVRDPRVRGMWVVPIGPGTGIATKFDVSGDLLVPNELMQMLIGYARTPRHTDRMIKANKDDKSLLFLTRNGQQFMPTTVAREMVDLRRSSMRAGLKFMEKFKFHQSRATFGTWLMSISLKATSVNSVKTAIEFVKRAMHHKHEATTFRYITFIEHNQAKIEVANAFTDSFLGLASRLKESENA